MTEKLFSRRGAVNPYGERRGNETHEECLERIRVGRPLTETMIPASLGAFHVEPKFNGGSGVANGNGWWPRFQRRVANLEYQPEGKRTKAGRFFRLCGMFGHSWNKEIGSTARMIIVRHECWRCGEVWNYTQEPNLPAPVRRQRRAWYKGFYYNDNA